MGEGQMGALLVTLATFLWGKIISKWKVERGRGFPGGAVDQNPPANGGDTGLSPGPGGSHTPRSN